MVVKMQATDVANALIEFSKINNLPTLKIIIESDDDFKDTQLHSATKEVLLDDFLTFCKKVSVSFFTYSEFVLEKSDLNEIKEDEKDGEEEEDAEDELELSPKAKSIIVDSVKKQVTSLESRVGQVGCAAIWGHKDKNVFKFVVTDDWYEQYLKLSEVFENIEKNGPEILTSDEILIFNKEVGIRESRESIMKRREAELDIRKEKYFSELSADRIFLNSKNLTLRMARAEKLMPKELKGFVIKREAVDGAVNFFMQKVEKMRLEGVSKKDIASAVGVSEPMLKKYVDLE
jgi:hypothetical protein